MKLSLPYRSEYPAFTLIEFLVATSVVIILSIIIMVNYEFGGHQFTLQSSGHKLAQDVSRIEEMAMAVREFRGSVPLGGYGVYFDRINYPTSYFLFADNNGDYIFDKPEIIEEIRLKENILIDHVYLGKKGKGGERQTGATVTFSPPDPIIRIDGGFEYDFIDITLRSTKTNETIIISVNKAGLIEVK